MTLLLGDEGIRMAPGDGQTPLRLLLDQYSELLAFPQIFAGHSLNPQCDGCPLTYVEISKSMARRYDRSAVQRTDFLLFMDRKRQLCQLAGNSLYA